MVCHDKEWQVIAEIRDDEFDEQIAKAIIDGHNSQLKVQE